jgi:hypothetical protein
MTARWSGVVPPDGEVATPLLPEDRSGNPALWACSPRPARSLQR